MTKKELEKLNKDVFKILKGYKDWSVDWNSDMNATIIHYQDGNFIASVSDDGDDLSPNFTVGIIYDYPEDLIQPIGELNNFNDRFDAVKVTLWEQNSQIVFTTCTSAELLSNEYIRFALWSSAKISFALDVAIADHMLSCFVS